MLGSCLKCGWTEWWTGHSSKPGCNLWNPGRFSSVQEAQSQQGGGGRSPALNAPPSPALHLTHSTSGLARLRSYICTKNPSDTPIIQPSGSNPPCPLLVQRVMFHRPVCTFLVCLQIMPVISNGNYPWFCFVVPFQKITTPPQFWVVYCSFFFCSEWNNLMCYFYSGWMADVLMYGC